MELGFTSFTQLPQRCQSVTVPNFVTFSCHFLLLFYSTMLSFLVSLIHFSQICTRYKSSNFVPYCWGLTIIRKGILQSYYIKTHSTPVFVCVNNQCCVIFIYKKNIFIQYSVAHSCFVLFEFIEWKMLS